MAHPEPQQPQQPQPVADPMALSALAGLMTAKEDCAIFRRFDELNLLNLLILQDEIRKLTDRFNELRSQTTTDTGVVVDAWYMPAQPLGNRNAPRGQHQAIQEVDAQRQEVWAQLKAKLSEYNTALTELAQLRSMEPPNAQNIKRLRIGIDKLVARSLLAEDVTKSWDTAFEDDFAVIRSGANERFRPNMWIRLGFEIFKWEIWGRHKAAASTLSTEPRVIVLGKKKPRTSRAEQARKHAFVSRLLMASFGGIALLLPTIIMSKVQEINVSLITTSVAVLVFGLALVFGATDSTGKDVLAATAAYTAVLVVFVGTSLAGSSNVSTETEPLGNATTTAS
ncbi:hypothetical protein B0T16DRAFT_139687 [Cercophora newfieldiana]|uniref:DUF6594 domain-containing protein n=1 Tax=Cercophora newfieldiana TaxID=92897 RepID=A0AA39Y3T3_9PEZI|nr:hypothetical protein B0T16DRAFT_139687 [Cercophora newfieldiana]